VVNCTQNNVIKCVQTWLECG